MPRFRSRRREGSPHRRNPLTGRPGQGDVRWWAAGWRRPWTSDRDHPRPRIGGDPARDLLRCWNQTSFPYGWSLATSLSQKNPRQRQHPKLLSSGWGHRDSAREVSSRGPRQGFRWTVRRVTLVLLMVMSSSSPFLTLI